MFTSLKEIIKNSKREYLDSILVKNKSKIFCIGRNKTGTTSVKRAFEDLGYIVGHQRTAENLNNEYFGNNFKPLINYCKTAQVFQDVPFSYPETFKHIDKAFPNSKFILTVRDSPEQWYNSITKFHAKLFGKGDIPNATQLKEALYVRKGWIWQNIHHVYQTPENDPYNKKIMINHYIDYNKSVIKYFEDRPENLLVINLSEKGSYKKFVDFLEIKSPYDMFPWENKTKSYEIR